MNKNAPAIREIIDLTNNMGGTRISGKNNTEIKQQVLTTLQTQLAKSKQNARKKAH